VQTTPVNMICLSRSVGRRHQIAAVQSDRQVPNFSLYRHLLHKVTGPAVNFTELLIAARFICNFSDYNCQLNCEEMHI
jgi:hypothetical protein